MLFPVQRVDVLAHFNIAVTFGALVAVGGASYILSPS